MLSLEFLKATILALTMWHGASKEIDAEVYSYYIITYSDLYHVDPALATAVIYRESTFDQYAISSKEAIGLGQIRRHTVSSKGYDKLGRKALFDPNLNIMLTLRALDHSRTVCNSDNPNVWLSVYNGIKKRNGHCIKSRYSMKVMKTYRLIKKMEKQNGTTQASN